MDGCGSKTRTVTPDSPDRPSFMELGELNLIHCFVYVYIDVLLHSPTLHF